jgi:hypothetical protein
VCQLGGRVFPKLAKKKRAGQTPQRPAEYRVRAQKRVVGNVRNELDTFSWRGRRRAG